MLTTVVVERLAVVDITTGPGDNAHRIFQSLNATGVNLTQADLLRNLIFMLLPTRASEVYADVWRPMERLMGFANLEGLARVDLQRRGLDVAVDDVFRRHQNRLENLPGGEMAVENAVRDLALRARHYKKIIDPAHEENPEVRAGLHLLRRWGAQTSHPILMAAYDLVERGLLSVEGLREVISCIESFLIRRHLAGISTNALNRLFVQLVEHLPQDDTFPQALRQELSQPRRYWPRNDQLRDAIRGTSLLPQRPRAAALAHPGAAGAKLRAPGAPGAGRLRSRGRCMSGRRRLVRVCGRRVCGRLVRGWRRRRCGRRFVPSVVAVRRAGR